jgi:hypothetical protein
MFNHQSGRAFNNPQARGSNTLLLVSSSVEATILLVCLKLAYFLDQSAVYRRIAEM